MDSCNNGGDSHPLLKSKHTKRSEMKAITQCRICSGNNLTPVLSLGEQCLTGIFPKKTSSVVTTGPLDLIWCQDCGLLQLGHSFPLPEMYGANYGYRSGLNKSMVSHLQQKIAALEKTYPLMQEDVVLDIGSNDATTLKSYRSPCKKVGIDPTGEKFKNFYTDEIALLSDFFSAKLWQKTYGDTKIKIITSIAMFYDLESPLDFVRDIELLLDDNGIWHFEQSYMPSMLRTNAYDTIRHEHLEFYSFKIICEILDKCNMKVIDVQTNSINGGSFAVTACKKNAHYKANTPIIQWMLSQEREMNLQTLKPYKEFEDRIYQHKKNLRSLVESLTSSGKIVAGYGASTKGNVLLQFCELTTKHIPYIAEINEEKFGAFTPGTNIPIISEDEAKFRKPDYFLVLPWHFKSSILERERDFLSAGGKLIFPLPEIEII